MGRRERPAIQCSSRVASIQSSVPKQHAQESVSVCDQFGTLLATTKPGNGASVAFHYDSPEITPEKPAIEMFFDSAGNKVAALAPAEEARALIESRFLSMRFHAEFIGLKMDR